MTSKLKRTIRKSKAKLVITSNNTIQIKLSSRMQQTVDEQAIGS